MANKKTSGDKNFKEPTGHRGSRKTPIDPMSLVIRGEGQYKTYKSGSGTPYLGTDAPFLGSFNLKQARLNRSLGLC